MQIILNGRKENIDQESLTLNDLIKLKEFTFRLLLTKVNGQLIRKPFRESRELLEGDRVDVIHLINAD